MRVKNLLIFLALFGLTGCAVAYQGIGQSRSGQAIESRYVVTQKGQGFLFEFSLIAQNGAKCRGQVLRRHAEDKSFFPLLCNDGLDATATLISDFERSVDTLSYRRNGGEGGVIEFQIAVQYNRRKGQAAASS